MNNRKQHFFKFFALVFSALVLNSCSNTDDVVAPANEGEFITTVRLQFVPTTAGKTIVLEYKDLDGEGANAPQISISSPFERSKTYNGSITFRDDLAIPAIDITPEIIAEATEHQMFFQTTGTLQPFTYSKNPSNFDKNGKPLGLEFTFTTTTAATGTLRASLRHGPNKNASNVALGDITNASGATDIEVDFPITVE